MRRVLFVTPTLDPDRDEVIQLGVLARRLPAHGYAASVAVLGPRTTGAVDPHVPTRFLGADRCIDLAGWRALRQWLRDEPPDVIHAWGPEALRAVRWAAPDRRAVASLFRPSARSALARVSDLLKPPRAAAWLTHEPSAVVPPAGGPRASVPLVVEPPEGGSNAAGVRRALGLPAGARLIMASGRLDRVDDFLPAVRAFDFLKYLYPDLYFVLFGGGPARERLCRWAVGLGRGEVRTLLPGPRADVGELFGLAELAWVPNADGVSAALAAAAVGRPVVAADSPPLHRAVRHGETGSLVRPGDPVELARATRALLDDPERAAASGQRAREEMLEHHSAGRGVRELVRVYDDVSA